MLVFSVLKPIKFLVDNSLSQFGGFYSQENMYCFSASFCFLCLKHYPKNELLDINKNQIKQTKIVDVLKYCGIDSNYCDDSYQVYICDKCVGKIKPFYFFKQNCAQNFTILKGYVHQMKENANHVFHANLKVIVTDPKYGDNNETIEYMDVSQFVETQIQADVMETNEAAPPPQKELVTAQPPVELVSIPINELDLNNPITYKEQLYELSKFLYENHFMNAPPDSDNNNVVASSPDSFIDIPENSSESFEYTSIKSKSYCSICSKVFMNSTHLSLHTFLHTLFTYPDTEPNKTMKYKCVLCKINIIGLAKIKEHLLAHTADTRYTCEKCKLDFLWYNDYIKHLKENPSHKPFSCDYCDQRFTSKYKQVLHSKNRHSINCLFCSGCFKTKADLKVHMVDKHNKKFCYICSSSFKSNDGLKKHLFDNHFELQTVSDDGKPQYNCKKCVKVFLTKYSLNEHLGGCVGD